MSWFISEERDPQTGRITWAASCLEPGCRWSATGSRSGVLEAVGLEHSLSVRHERGPSFLLTLLISEEGPR
ncbi:MAG: hypothetical protein QG608_2999 [Actinomycetota bacterium]|nr:hypothetical protein [Actinomycetota bacterium]